MILRNSRTHVESHPVSPPRSEELRKEARQLKKELQAIKQRKEEGSKPAVENDQEGKRKQLLFRRVT